MAATKKTPPVKKKGVSDAPKKQATRKAKAAAELAPAAPAEAASAPSPVPSPLASFDQKAERLYALKAERKTLEREEDEIKAWFRAHAPDGSLHFEGETVVVDVVTREKTGIDQAELRKVVTADVLAACTKTTQYVQVDVREKKTESAA